MVCNTTSFSSDDKMNISFIKRRYYDMRLGGAQVSPLIQMANFTLISFLWINHLIPIEVFAPIFIVIGFVTLSYIGVRFRAHQASTDYNMFFERQSQQAKIFYEIMLSQKMVMEKNNIPPTKSFLEQLYYIQKVASEKI